MSAEKGTKPVNEGVYSPKLYKFTQTELLELIEMVNAEKPNRSKIIKALLKGGKDA